MEEGFIFRESKWKSQKLSIFVKMVRLHQYTLNADLDQENWSEMGAACPNTADPRYLDINYLE